MAAEQVQHSGQDTKPEKEANDLRGGLPRLPCMLGICLALVLRLRIPWSRWPDGEPDVSTLLRSW